MLGLLLLASFPTTLPVAHLAHFILGSLLSLQLAEKLLSQYLVPTGLRRGWFFSKYIFSSFSAQSLWHRKEYSWSLICSGTTTLTTLQLSRVAPKFTCRLCIKYITYDIILFTYFYICVPLVCYFWNVISWWAGLFSFSSLPHPQSPWDKEVPNGY